MASVATGLLMSNVTKVNAAHKHDVFMRGKFRSLLINSKLSNVFVILHLFTTTKSCI